MGIFNNMLGKIGSHEAISANDELARIEAGLHLAKVEAEIARNSASLRAVTSRVMIANQNNEIVSINDSALQMMREAQDDIRKEQPDFAISKIMGSNISSFFKQSMLENLNGTHHERIQTGGRTFDLVATPIFGPEMQHIGTVVEWNDLSEQLVQEKMDKVKFEKDAVQAADNLRIRQALDAVTTNVMMADANFNIIYANSAVIGMLKDAENDLRKELPNFSAGITTFR